VDLPARAFAAGPRQGRQRTSPFTLLTVGTLAQLYKAPDVLIDATEICVRDGFDVRLVLVGDGQYRRELEARAARLRRREHVRFLGQLPPGDAVRAQLDEADLFVLPSRQEGLPRAMVEAMARALPCIGSKVGGIPELLPDDDMVPPDDVLALARKMREILSEPGRLLCMSKRNLEKAREYRAEHLHERRIEFYKHLRETAEAWHRRADGTAHGA